MIWHENVQDINKEILVKYKTNIRKYGKSFKYGGAFIVPEVRDEIYEHWAFYQIAGEGWSIQEFENQTQPTRQN